MAHQLLSWSIERYPYRPDATLTVQTSTTPLLVESLISQTIFIQKSGNAVKFIFSLKNTNSEPYLVLECGCGDMERNLSWQLRQYADVRPYDQNHDPSPYSPLCVPQCCENCGVCIHGVCDITLGHLFPCMYSLGAYPCCVIGSPDYDVEANHQVEFNDDNVGPILSSCTHSCICLDNCTGYILSLLAVPTRGAGRCCGTCLRNSTPAQCRGGRCFENFQGPPKIEPCGVCFCCCTFERCVSDYAGGLGNCFTHIYRGSLQASLRGRRRYVEGCTEACFPVNESNQHQNQNQIISISKPQCCLATPVSKEQSLAIKRFGHACCSTFVNLSCLFMMSPEDVLLIGPCTECMDTLVNSDVYLQGPIIKQGYLKVEGACCQRFEKAWVVLRPWSLSVYASPDGVSSNRGPILIPTSSIFAVSSNTETPNKIELRTIDFSRYEFSVSRTPSDDEEVTSPEVTAPEASMNQNTINENTNSHRNSNIDTNNRINNMIYSAAFTAASAVSAVVNNSQSSSATTQGPPVGLPPRVDANTRPSNSDLITSWRLAFRNAAGRTESLSPYDQGIRRAHHYGLFSGGDISINLPTSTTRPSSTNRNSTSNRTTSSPSTGAAALFSTVLNLMDPPPRPPSNRSHATAPQVVVMEGRPVTEVPIAVAVPVQPTY